MAQTSSLVATAILSLTLGYWIGVGASLSGVLGRGNASSSDDMDDACPATSPGVASSDAPATTVVVSEKKKAEKAGEHDDDEDEWDSEDDSEDEDGPVEGLDKVQAGLFEPCKMVLLVRTDLGMTKGKIAAQCGHATLACYKTLQASNPKLLAHWERTGWAHMDPRNPARTLSEVQSEGGLHVTWRVMRTQAKIALQVKSEDDLLELQAIAASLNVCARDIQDAGRTQIAAGSRTVLGVGPAPVELINQITGHLKLL